MAPHVNDWRITCQLSGDRSPALLTVEPEENCVASEHTTIDGFRMNGQSNAVRNTRWIWISIFAVILLLFASTVWVWNSRNHPPTIAGDWILDDLRTEGDDATRVRFSSNGLMENGDAEFALRWRLENATLVIQYWHTDQQSLLGRYLSDTRIYSWFARSDEFSLLVEFNSDQTEMTLTAPDEGPRLRLRRTDGTIK